MELAWLETGMLGTRRGWSSSQVELLAQELGANLGLGLGCLEPDTRETCVQEPVTNGARYAWNPT